MIGVVFILAGFLGLLHQRLFTSGGWFDLQQVWHHEFLIAIFFAFGAGWLARGLRRGR